MDINQYRAKLNKLIGTFNQQLMAMVTIKGKGVSDLNEKIRIRVRNTGTNAKGSKFKPYSTGFLLLRPSMEATIGAGNMRKALAEANWYTTKSGKKHAILPGGYKRLRELSGRKTAFKNFEFTTAMWKDYGIKDKKVEDTNIKIISKGDKEQYKIDFNSEREGIEIIEPSQKEIEEFNAYVNKEVAKLLDIK